MNSLSFHNGLIPQTYKGELLSYEWHHRIYTVPLYMSSYGSTLSGLHSRCFGYYSFITQNVKHFFQIVPINLEEESSVTSQNSTNTHGSSANSIPVWKTEIFKLLLNCRSLTIMSVIMS